MQTTSADFDRLLAGTDYWYETRLVIDGVGTFGESDLFSINTSVEMFQQDPEIGKAIASEINVSMINPSATIPTMAKLRPQVRACGNAPKSSKVTITGENLISSYATYASENITFSSSSGATVAGENLSFEADTTEYLESEWLAQGVYFIDTRDVTQNNNGLDVLTMHGFDAMLKTEQIYSSNSAVGDNLDIAYVRSIASAIGVTVDPRTWDIMQTGYMIPFPLGYTMREILGYIASAYAGCFIISDVGQLRLVALENIVEETRYLIDEIGNIIVFGVDAPQHTVTASGEVATFTAGGEYPLEELEIAIEPLQSGSGDPSPNNVRPITGWTGMTINNAPTVITFEQGGLLDASGTTVNNANRIRSDYISASELRKSKNVLNLLRTNSSDNANIRKRYFYWYSSDKTYIHEANGTFNEAFPVELERSYIPEGAEYLRLVLQNYDNSIPILPDDYKVSINARKVDGNNQQAENLYDSSTNTDGYFIGADGTISANSSCAISDFIRVNNGTVCHVSGVGGSGATRKRVHCYGANKQWISQLWYTQDTLPQGTPYECTVTLPDNAYYLRISIGKWDTDVSVLNGDTATVSWQSTAGTVYKGTLNVLTGVLTGTHKGKSYTDAWSQASNGAFYLDGKATDGKSDAVNDQPNDVTCNMYPKGYNGGSTHIAVSHPQTLCTQNLNGTRFMVYDTTFASVSAFNTYVASNPIQIVYPLATPVTYQLSPTQVKTLLDHNNLWANTGNIINLEFTEPATEAVRILV